MFLELFLNGPIGSSIDRLGCTEGNSFPMQPGAAMERVQAAELAEACASRLARLRCNKLCMGRVGSGCTALYGQDVHGEGHIPESYNTTSS